MRCPSARVAVRTEVARLWELPTPLLTNGGHYYAENLPPHSRLRPHHWARCRGSEHGPISSSAAEWCVAGHRPECRGRQHPDPAHHACGEWVVERDHRPHLRQ